MVIEFFIVGGHIKMHKNIFIQEMLSKDSLLRPLLNWKTNKDFASKAHPCLSEPDLNNIVTINFDNHSIVSVGESPKEILGQLKKRYGDKIKGKVACRVEYNLFGGIMNFSVGLDSDNEEIDYIMNN